MPADRSGTAVDRLATLETDLRDLAGVLVAEHEERLAAKPGEAEAGAVDGAAGSSGRRRRSGALLLALVLAPAVAAAIAALLFAGGREDDDSPPRAANRRAVPAPRPAAPLRLAADGAVTARALRLRGVFGAREAGRAAALAGLCGGAADVAVLRSAPRGAERTPAAGCELAVVAQVPVAVTRVVAPLGGCLTARRARGRAARPGATDAARRRAGRRAAPSALRRLRRDAPVRGRDAIVRRRVARQAATAATAAFDARRRLLPVGVRAARGGPCVKPRAAAIVSGAYPLTRRLVLVATTARAAAPAARRLAERVRATATRTRVRVRGVATFRAAGAQ